MKKKQPTIADVLNYASDECLLSNSRYGEGDGKERFSCCAVDTAIYKMTDSLFSGESGLLRHRVINGLKNMGCNTGSMTLFKKHGDVPAEYSNINHEVQGMRYMWLKWAALMAEEQGV